MQSQQSNTSEGKVSKDIDHYVKINDTWRDYEQAIRRNIMDTCKYEHMHKEQEQGNKHDVAVNIHAPESQIKEYHFKYELEHKWKDSNKTQIAQEK